MHGTIAQLQAAAAPQRRLAALAEQIKREHAAAEQAWKESVRHAIRCGELLLQAKAKLEHGQWQPWLRKHVKFAARTARDYMALASLSDEERRHVATLPLWQALKVNRPGPSVEYHTPARWIAPVRQVLGSITLDPASCEQANRTVRADRYFTQADDGLVQTWHGNIFLNPPWSGQTGAFVSKLVSEFKSGNVQAAILLCNGYFSDTAWFHQLWDDGLVCFTFERIEYRHASRKCQQHTNQNACFVYFGDDKERFRQIFSKLGTVVMKALG
jgi:hypothetical protein